MPASLAVKAAAVGKSGFAAGAEGGIGRGLVSDASAMAMTPGAWGNRAQERQDDICGGYDAGGVEESPGG